MTKIVVVSIAIMILLQSCITVSEIAPKMTKVRIVLRGPELQRGLAILYQSQEEFEVTYIKLVGSTDGWPDIIYAIPEYKLPGWKDYLRSAFKEEALDATIWFRRGGH